MNLIYDELIALGFTVVKPTHVYISEGAGGRRKASAKGAENMTWRWSR